MENVESLVAWEIKANSNGKPTESFSVSLFFVFGAQHIWQINYRHFICHPKLPTRMRSEKLNENKQSRKRQEEKKLIWAVKKKLDIFTQRILIVFTRYAAFRIKKCERLEIIACHMFLVLSEKLPRGVWCRRLSFHLSFAPNKNAELLKAR